mmetsp:Transcript_5269/g.9666  ORF Transcript_5269/g.9666 Transcript_5269/m.9666 type:complete len:241 (-) Transcript_5269:36-758(-)
MSETDVAPNELASFRELRELCEKNLNDPSESRFIETDALLRFLRAREHNAYHALEMWIKWKDWRIEYNVENITEHSVMPLIQSGKAFWHGYDRQSRPCLVIRVRYHVPGQFSVEQTMRYAVFLLEQGTAESDRVGSKQICVIHDRGQMTKKNKDDELMTIGRTLSSMLQDFYAERLGALYVLHVNWFYWLMFQMMKPLLSKKTRNKIHIMNKPRELQQYFDPAQLLAEHEGTSLYSHPYP